MAKKQNKLQWLDEFENLANEVLSAEENAASEQIRTLVKAWYENIVQRKQTENDQSIKEAMHSLTSEVMADIPEPILRILSETVDDEDVVRWLHNILMLGRAFENALQEGRLNNL